MPEAIATALVINRVEDEVLNVNESILNLIFSADIVKMVADILNFNEADDYDVARAWDMPDVMNVGEVAIHVITSTAAAIIKVIDDVINSTEVVFRKIAFVPDVPIVKIVHEWFQFRAWYRVPILDPPYWDEMEYVKVLGLVRIRQEAYFFHEDQVTVLEELVVKVIDEAVNSVEDIVKLVTSVTLELVKVIDESMSFLDSSVVSIVKVLGVVKVINETLAISGNEIMEPVIFVMGQLVARFNIVPRVRAIFRINQDVDQ